MGINNDESIFKQPIPQVIKDSATFFTYTSIQCNEMQINAKSFTFIFLIKILIVVHSSIFPTTIDLG